MKNLKINKEAIGSGLLAGSILLSACGTIHDIKAKKDETKTPEPIVIEETINEAVIVPTEKQSTYLNKNNVLIDLNELNNGYTNVTEDNKYTLFTGANIYYTDGWNIIDEKINDQYCVVTVLASNSIYSQIKLSDGKVAYVDNALLINCANLNQYPYTSINEYNDTILCLDAYLYDNNGMYIDYLREGQHCQIEATNGEYTLVNLPNGARGYVIDLAIMNSYEKVNGYAFINYNTPMYLDKNLTELSYYSTDNDIIYVTFTNRICAAVIDYRGRELYINRNDIRDDFILVDLDNQRIDCYIDYQLAGSWGTRSGKDSTPTHTGAYDIDAKAIDWEFTTYPGSYAKYWIPLDPETQEGIHDLVGDDEWNYGNETYHAYGSHGCIRVPKEASEFVYNNYNIGDMVLVRRK